MTDKELREIKRRFRPERSNITKIVGCLVGANKEIISKISQPIMLSDSVVAEKLLSVMKRSLSGTPGVNLNTVDFSTRQVESSPEHKLLMTLKNSRLEDEAALGQFYQGVIESLEFDTSFAILLANDVYDVPSYSKNGEQDGSSEVFSYIVTSICPIKSLPEAISFKQTDGLFHLLSASGVLAAPELGFMFPAFDDRRSNIYAALTYVKNLGRSYPEFMNRIFASEAPMPPKAQGETFSGILEDTLKEELSFEVVRSIQKQICEMQEAHKESGIKEPLTVTRETVKGMLENCGIAEDKLERLGENFDESFGKNATLTPKNIIKTDKLKLSMPEVKISVSPEYRDIVSTQIIGEDKYLLIKVTGSVEVNGVNISIEE